MIQLKRICDFATGNAHTIVLIYAIIAVAVWVAVNLYFWKISFDLESEIREEMREYGDCYSYTDEAKFGKHITRLTGFIISILAAVMWWCTPLIVAGAAVWSPALPPEYLPFSSCPQFEIICFPPRQNHLL